MGRGATRDDEGTAGVTSVRVSTSGGRIRVQAQDRPDVLVEGATAVVRDGDRLTVDGGDRQVVVRVPRGTELLLGSVTGRVEVTGRAGRVAVVTTSGGVEVDRAESLDVRTEGGRVRIGRVGGECRVGTGSGRVSIEESGAAEVTTVSGRIDIGEAVGPVRAHCVSGRIEVRLAVAQDVSAETVNGRVTVVVPTGTLSTHQVVARSGGGRVDVRER